MNKEELIRHADKLPSMGGKELGTWLRSMAAAVPQGSCVVEVGTWLGAGTAQLAIGAAPGVPVHTFDRFTMTHESYARGHFGVELRKGENTLATVERFLRPFRNVLFHRGDVSKRKGTWKVPIGLLVMDACKTKSNWERAMAHFGPALVPGAGVVLMDYFFGDKSGKAKYGAQKEWIKHHPEFHFMERPLSNCCAAVFVHKP